jgi:hypothetical protein
MPLHRIAITALLAVALAAAPATAAEAQPAAPDTIGQVRLLARATEPHGVPIAAVTSLAGVGALQLVDPDASTARTVSTNGGVHVTLCRGSLRPCRLPARSARAQARAIARRAFAETQAALVVVALPQSPTRHLQLVFERARLDERDPLYAMAGLVTPEDEDILVLVRLS